jgi:hypothetical protein
MKAWPFLRTARLLLLYALVAFAAAPPGRGLAAQGEPLPRRILALYDSAAESRDDCRIRRWAEAPLNHLGYVVDYRDVSKPLPAPDQIRGHAAVLTWFAGPVEGSGRYLQWAGETARQGTKFIILGETGGRFWTKELLLINELLEQIGLRHTGRYVDVTFDTGLATKLAPFEAVADPAPPPYPVMTPARPDLKTWVELAVPAREGGGRGVAAAFSGGGGFVASGFEMMVETRLDRVRWLIDPFLVFKTILDAREWPRPDVTTGSGRRLLLTLADIDEPSSRARANEAPPLAALLQNVVAPHADIPMTLSFNPEDFSSEARSALSGRDQLLALLRLRQIEGAFRPNFCEGKKVLGANKACLPLPAFEKDGRAMLSRGNDAGDRIGLIQLTSSEAWSATAARAALRAGLRPIQEATSRYSAPNPSVAYVAPLARDALAAPVALLPGDVWSPRTTQGMQVFLDMETTAANTENPRRLAPLFWRFQLNALTDPDTRDLIGQRLAQFETDELTPVAVGAFAAMVADFANCEIIALSEKSWRVKKLGAVRTFRLDDAGRADVDFSRSVGVVGARRRVDALYITIDAARDEATIALRDAETPAPRPVALRDSRWTVAHLERGLCGWTFVAGGFGPGDFTWRNVTAGRYDVTATAPDGENWSGSALADASGQLHFSAPLPSRENIRFTVRCAPGASREAR